MKPIFLGKCESDELLDLTTGESRGFKNVFLSSDDLKTHLHGVGAPGSGKSKMIEWIVRELIDRQEGFCLMDPHGTLYENVVQYLAFQRPKQEIILFNPSYNGRIVGFNPFRAHQGDISVQVDRMAKVIVRVRGELSTDEKPRLERMLKATLHSVLELNMPLDIVRYLLSFEERAVRTYLIDQIQSPNVKNEFKDLDRFKRIDDFILQVESVKNRLGRFLESQQVRRIVNLVHHTLDFQDIIENKKIVICNLHDQGDLMSLESASLLGTLLLNEIWTVAKQRKGKGGGDPHDFFVIIDEFQNFITPDIPEILPQSRKFGLKFMLFHQYLGQLRDKDSRAYDAVMNTCQTKIVFGGLMIPDAETMVRELFPGEINLKRVKFLNQQVEFWPEVGRAQSHTVSDSDSEGYTTGGSGSSGSGTSQGMSFGPGFDDWVMSDVRSNMDTYSDMSSNTNMKTHSESNSDVPFIYPVKHIVDHPPETYTMQEMERILASLLKRQYQRHYFIARSGQPTVAAVSPTVNTVDPGEKQVSRYTEKCLQSYLTPEEVDRELIEVHQQLALAAGSKEISNFNPDEIWEKPVDNKEKT